MDPLRQMARFSILRKVDSSSRAREVEPAKGEQIKRCRANGAMSATWAFRKFLMVVDGSSAIATR